MMSEGEEVNKDAAYYLSLAKEANNYDDCMSNIEKALSLEPLNYDVLLYKFLWIVTTANLTNNHLAEAKEIEETILTVTTADDGVCMNIYGYYRKHAVDIMLRTIKMLGNRPDVKIYNEVMNEYVAMTRKSLDMMRRGYTGVAIPNQNDYLEAAYKRFSKEAQVFDLMFNFAFSIIDMHMSLSSIVRDTFSLTKVCVSRSLQNGTLKTMHP